MILRRSKGPHTQSAIRDVNDPFFRKLYRERNLYLTR